MVCYDKHINYIDNYLENVTIAGYFLIFASNYNDIRCFTQNNYGSFVKKVKDK